MPWADRKAAMARAKAAGMCVRHTTTVPAVRGTLCLPCSWNQAEKSLFLRHGLSVEEYARMELAQERKCAICFRFRPDGQDLAVDHNHATEKIRGLLCIPCNRWLGYVERYQLKTSFWAYLARNGEVK